MTDSVLPPLDSECFFIAPIGDEGSEVRARSDGVMDFIVAPAAEALELVTVRADKIAQPGEITRQVIEHVVGAKAAVVDLTGANPNVYYEMAIRHTARLPTVLIAEDGEDLPFDVSQMRTIFFDATSLRSASRCKGEITEHLKAALAGQVDSPVAASVSVQQLEEGDPRERLLVQIADGVNGLRSRLDGLELRTDQVGTRRVQGGSPIKMPMADILRIVGRVLGSGDVGDFELGSRGDDILINTTEPAPDSFRWSMETEARALGAASVHWGRMPRPLHADGQVSGTTT